MSDAISALLWSLRVKFVYPLICVLNWITCQRLKYSTKFEDESSFAYVLSVHFTALLYHKVTSLRFVIDLLFHVKCKIFQDVRFRLNKIFMTALNKIFGPFDDIKKCDT